MSATLHTPIHHGMVEKMRTVIMTGFMPAIGFVPFALALPRRGGKKPRRRA